MHFYALLLLLRTFARNDAQMPLREPFLTRNLTRERRSPLLFTLEEGQILAQSWILSVNTLVPRAIWQKQQKWWF